MTIAYDPLAVVGAGAWGTALANAAARNGRRVLIWARDGEQIAAMRRDRVNEKRLPGVPLADAIEPVADLEALAQARAVLLATPAQTTRATAEALRSVLPAGVPLIVTAKGIERDSGDFPRRILEAILPACPVALLSGPSFAADVARGLPTAVVLAASDGELARSLASALSGPTLRLYHGNDPRGVEIGGAAKNVLAIAAGIVEGRRLGESAKAALIARGFAELVRFATARGGRADTLMGLSGLGDVVLTCGSTRSRNFAFGVALGAGADPATARGGKLVEGEYTAGILDRLAREAGIEMPIVAAVAAVLAGTWSIEAAAEALMRRPIKAES